MTRALPSHLVALVLSGLMSISCSTSRAVADAGSMTTDRANGTSVMAALRKLRVVTFNIYNRPWERAKRLQSAVETLQRLDADIVLLQEVATGWILPGNPVEKFATALKLHAASHWHEENLGIFRTGVAILSRYPIRSTEYHEFAHHQFWDAKGYLLVRIDLPGNQTLQALTVHMASTSNANIRRSEWQELADFIQPLRRQGPVLIGGDFNTEPTDPVIQDFKQSLPGIHDLYDGWKNIAQMRSWTPDYRDSCAALNDGKSQLLDYFFIAPAVKNGSPSANTPAAINAFEMAFAGGRIVIPGHPPHPSDHCPVVADLNLGK